MGEQNVLDPFWRGKNRLRTLDEPNRAVPFVLKGFILQNLKDRRRKKRAKKEHLQKRRADFMQRRHF